MIQDPAIPTPLSRFSRELGGRMVEFSGYDMALQFEGIMAEHAHTRDAASLFDVSHMGQAELVGDGRIEALEALVPGDIAQLAPGSMRYTMLTNEEGGIIDDLMVSNMGDRLFLVVNASRKDVDFAHISGKIEGRGAKLRPLKDRALIALQGPKAAGVLAEMAPEAAGMGFMMAAAMDLDGLPCLVTRSGYTGEDGFEISLPGEAAEKLAGRLLRDERVRPAGLGARDSLRLEAGLCLYGSDIDETTTPIEAGLAWTISKRRRQTGGFPGDRIIHAQLVNGVARRRVGLLPEGKAPVRAHAEILDSTGRHAGEVTSGGFGPSLGAPVAMGYVRTGLSEVGTDLQLVLRGRNIAGKVAALPFVPHRYVRKGAGK